MSTALKIFIFNVLLGVITSGVYYVALYHFNLPYLPTAVVVNILTSIVGVAEYMYGKRGH